MKSNKLKILNDPIYGLISIPSETIYDLIEHPIFQRLRRIAQTGLTYLVYPGATHTRFHHAIGCMHLMKKALAVLKTKGLEITKEEEEATLIAILLHDIGHGPFSHALEHNLLKGVDHESISLALMQQLNLEMDNKLSLAIQIFTKQYHKPFLYQLISSHLDVDRMDYLTRDSFYTGVSEGVIGVDRILMMLNVKDGELVLEVKAIDSIEKFIMARKFMYWQVYLHKTGMGAELLLNQIVLKAKDLYQQKEPLFLSSDLEYLFKRTHKELTKDDLTCFLNLDDIDINYHIKKWCKNPDNELAKLSNMLINRNLYKVKKSNNPFSSKKIQKIKDNLSELNIKNSDYFVHQITVKTTAYKEDKESIKFMFKNSKVKKYSKVVNQLDYESISKQKKRYYLYYLADTI